MGIALFFLAVGLMTSSTLVSGFYILMLVPAILLYFDRKNKIFLSKSSLMLLLLFAWGIISGLAHLGEMENVRKSFDELKFYLFGFAFIMPLRYYGEHTTKHQHKKIINLFLFTLIVCFIAAGLDSWFGIKLRDMTLNSPSGRSGGFVHIMRYGYSNALVFVLLLATYFNRKKLQEFITPKLFYPALVCSLLAVFAAQTRGAILGLFASIPFLLYRYKPKMAKIVLGLGVAAFIGMVGVSLSLGDKSPIRLINLKDNSSSIRVSQYLTGLIAMKENLLLGLGPTQLSYHVADIKDRHDLWAKDYTGQHSHNTFIEHGASFGVPGFILFILFLAFWFKEMIGLRSDFGWAIASYIVG